MLRAVAERLLAPGAGNDDPRPVGGSEQVDRDHCELHRRSALDEEDVEVIRYRCDPAECLQRPHVHRLVLLRTMRQLDERHSGAVEIREFGGDLFQDVEREGARPGPEIVSSHHRPFR